RQRRLGVRRLLVTWTIRRASYPDRVSSETRQRGGTIVIPTQSSLGSSIVPLTPPRPRLTAFAHEGERNPPRGLLPPRRRARDHRVRQQRRRRGRPSADRERRRIDLAPRAVERRRDHAAAAVPDPRRRRARRRERRG